MAKEKLSQSYLSIRNRILIFSVLATLVPSLGMGWLLNSMMHNTITEKIEQKLLDSTSAIDREISLWFKERNYDLRIFSSSYIITENYTRYLEELDKRAGQPVEGQVYYKNIVTYLTSVKDQFEYFSRLFVFDNGGQLVAASGKEVKESPVTLSPDEIKQMKNDGFFKGEVYFKGQNKAPFMLIGAPLISDKFDKNIGVLAIEVQLLELVPLLQSSIFKTKADSRVSASLVRISDGRQFLTIEESATDSDPVSVSQDILNLIGESSSIHEFRDHNDLHVVGIVTLLKDLNWGLIISENHEAVYAKLISSRNRNIIIVLLFALIIGLAAYHFSTRIITPLTTLTNGAMRVAGGDLDVRLPIYINDELGLTTKVFNEMVVELHQSHDKLKELATTDTLTNLSNRKRIMEVLTSYFDQYRRYATPFSILMIDIDFFKNINDTHGHLAGDAVLKQVAKIFLKSLRNVDYTGRYGGEEFLVVLPETNGEEACKSGERIREATKNHIFLHEKQALRISVSIGVATADDGDKDVDSLIGRADDALYQAKDSGRNQVVYFRENQPDDKVVPISGSVKK